MTGTLITKKDRPNHFIILRHRDESTRKEHQKWITTDIPVKGNNKRKAERLLAETLTEYQVAKIDISNDILFTDFLQRWLDSRAYSIRATTHSQYKKLIINQIISFFLKYKLRVRDVKPFHIQEYVNLKVEEASANTALKHLICITKALDSAISQNIIAFNPAKRIEKPKKVKYRGAQFYSEGEIKQLLDCIKGSDIELAVLLTIFYGFRRSEVLGLCWSAIDFERNLITVKHTIVICEGKPTAFDNTKNDSSHRTIPMPALIKDALLKEKGKQDAHKALQPNDYHNTDYVCVYPNGKPIAPRYLTRHFKNLLNENDMREIRFHDLRHSTASYLLGLGFNMKEISDWLGHSSIQTTMNFCAHINMEQKHKMAQTINDRLWQFSI